MPAIVDAARQLCADDLPVLFVDTCALLDVVRAPVRRIPRCVQSAVELVKMQAEGRCRIVASSMIRDEWNNNEEAVEAELDRHLALRDQDAIAFHEACQGVGVPVTFSTASYRAAGLAVKLLETSTALLESAIHLLPSDETNLRAHNRTVKRVRPARKGSGPQDCVIVEEYLELCRLLQAAGFANKKVFCSSNTEDYQEGRDLHETLASEFAAVGLVFTNALDWAVSELKKPAKEPETQ